MSVDQDVACPNGRRTTTKEGVCTTKAFSVTRRLFSILLALLRLRTYRCICRADLGISEVDRSAPLLEAMVRARGGRCGNSSAPPPQGVAPVRISPCGKAIEPMGKPVAVRPWKILRISHFPTTSTMAIIQKSSSLSWTYLWGKAKQYIDSEMVVHPPDSVESRWAH